MPTIISTKPVILVSDKERKSGRVLQAGNLPTSDLICLTPTADTNGVGCPDPLSDMRTLSSQVGDHIGQLCGIF